MMEGKTQWRETVSDELKKIIDEAKALKDFLEMFFKRPAAQLSLIGNLPTIVGEAIEMLEELIEIARTIETEISKEEVDWEKIKKVFPPREWLGSLEMKLFQLDSNKIFRRIMPYYQGSLREHHFNPIWNAFQTILDIFTNKLGRMDIHKRFMEAPKKEPPTEEELEQEYREAKKTPKPEDLPSLFNEISRILMEEFKGNKDFLELWNDITQQFENALKTRNKYELWDVHRQVRSLFEGMSEEKREKYKGVFDRFTDAVRTTYPLRKFKLIRHLLGLE
jgi:hypothetical protein